MDTDLDTRDSETLTSFNSQPICQPIQWLIVCADCACQLLTDINVSQQQGDKTLGSFSI